MLKKSLHISPRSVTSVGEGAGSVDPKGASMAVTSVGEGAGSVEPTGASMAVTSIARRSVGFFLSTPKVKSMIL